MWPSRLSVGRMAARPLMPRGIASLRQYSSTNESGSSSSSSDGKFEDAQPQQPQPQQPQNQELSVNDRMAGRGKKITTSRFFEPNVAPNFKRPEERKVSQPDQSTRFSSPKPQQSPQQQSQSPQQPKPQQQQPQQQQQQQQSQSPQQQQQAQQQAQQQQQPQAQPQSQQKPQQPEQKTQPLQEERRTLVHNSLSEKSVNEGDQGERGRGRARKIEDSYRERRVGGGGGGGGIGSYARPSGGYGYGPRPARERGGRDRDGYSQEPSRNRVSFDSIDESSDISIKEEETKNLDQGFFTPYEKHVIETQFVDGYPYQPMTERAFKHTVEREDYPLWFDMHHSIDWDNFDKIPRIEHDRHFASFDKKELLRSESKKFKTSDEYLATISTSHQHYWNIRNFKVTADRNPFYSEAFKISMMANIYEKGLLPC